VQHRARSLTAERSSGPELPRRAIQWTDGADLIVLFNLDAAKP
jgi:hypothetical protein